MAEQTPLSADRELVSDFILESREHLQTIESNLLRLEKNAGEAEAIHAAFRGFHTIKGLAGFLEFPAIQQVAHEVETLLDRARNFELEITAETIDVVLASVDYLKSCLVELEGALQTGAPFAGGENGELIRRVRLYSDPAQAADRGSGSVPDLLQLNSAVDEQGETGAPGEKADDESPAARETPAAEGEPAARAVLAAAAPTETRVVKVDTGKLDHLVDMVGEMVIAQSMIQHDPDLASLDRPRLTRNLLQLTRITSEVQKTAMAMRMMPIGNLFRRMQRVVRDLGRKTGKQADLEISGEDTELDRNLVEELADPLMHMLRNSVDHGIETAEKRVARGKPGKGRVVLRASHQSGNIVIEVSDDGNGLDRQRILDKAIANGLLTPGSNPPDSEVYNLIFHPGFSTAVKVTSVSGRGVGMDVVRRQVQKLRGRVEIRSMPGEGTTFLLKLPLTLAILDGLVVGVGAERYIIPLFAVREMLRPARESIFTVQDKGEIAMVRERLLPLVRLYRRFGLEPRSEDPAGSLLIVAENTHRTFALLVDALLGKQEVVIKSLGGYLQDVRGVAGGAILGDGRVALILDLDRIYESGRNSDNGSGEF
jgi:two-component system, chemotaxis family, sensor kinase CheA